MQEKEAFLKEKFTINKNLIKLSKIQNYSNNKQNKIISNQIALKIIKFKLTITMII